MKRELKNLRAVVTGASSGIGREIALELARNGVSVVVTARREDRIAELVRQIEAVGARVASVAGDITDPEVRHKTLEAARTNFDGLDILVNNAGVGATGLFENADPQRARQIMEVNYFSLVEMTRLAIPMLKRGRSPIIVNVSSILGHRGVPHNSEYAASKFAVHGFSESIRAELVQHGIDVLVVSPGTTETEFFDNVLENTTSPKWPEHKAVTAAEVARQTVKAIRLGRHEIIPYRWGKIFCLLNRISPRFLDWLMTRYV